MKLHQIFCAVFVFLCHQAWARPTAPSGHEQGNGGGAVVCRDSSGKIVSAELLDLWERRASKQATYQSSAAVNDLIKWALVRISKNNAAFGARVRQAYEENRKIVTEVADGISLKSPDDAFEWMFEDGCKLEGAANYQTRFGNDRLYIDLRIVQMMSPTSQAALWIHEAIYKVLRQDDGDTNSLRTRDIVSQIFASEPVPEMNFNNLHRFICLAQLPANAKVHSLVADVFWENGQVHLWIGRYAGKWQFPALTASPLTASHSEFHSLFRFAFEGVSNESDWQQMASQFLTFAPISPDAELMAASLFKNKTFSPGGPVYSFGFFVDSNTKAVCFQR